MIPCGGAKVNRIAGFFRAWGEFLPGRAPLPPVWWVCRSGAQGVACFLCRLLTLPLAYFLSPIPPPALAERSSPPGKGVIFSFLMQGAPPLASPGLNPGGTYSPSKTGTQRRACPSAPCVVGLPRRCPRGGVLSLSPAYPAFSLLCCPHPPAPLPSGKGEIQSLFRRGLRPRHPGIRPLAALTSLAMQVPGG